MRILVISDTHDNLENLKKIIKIANKQKFKVIFHCGDLISPFMMKELVNFKGKVYVVFGNNDGDKESLIKNKPKNVKIFGIYGETRIKGKSIAFVHYDFFGVALAMLNKFDFVFCGHSHKAYVKRFSNTLLVNPGELAGVINDASYAIIDLRSKEAKIVYLE